MGEGSGEIIIKGGSVELNFDVLTYQKVLTDPSTYRSANRQITRVLVEDQEGKVKFDGIDGAGQWSITIYTR